MTDVYNYDGYQIAHVGLTGDMMSGGIGAQHRDYSSRMSNFGALVGGLRNSSDYTKTSLGFKDKDELMNPKWSEMDQATWAEGFRNPFVWGSTVKRIRNDEFKIMGLGSRVSNSTHDAPKMDVMDTNLSVDDGTNAPKAFPNEGWHNFGSRTGGPFGWVTPGTQPV